MAHAPAPLSVRLSDPGELAAALPHLIGFRPRESLLAVSLRGSRGRSVGLTARVDLPPEELRERVVAGLVRSIGSDRPGAVVLAVVSEAPDEATEAEPAVGDPAGARVLELPHRALVHEAVQQFSADGGVPISDVLLVRSGRWWSYDCPEECCLPRVGIPLPGGTSQLAVAAALTGQVVEDDRTALDRRIAPVGSVAAAAMARACEEVGDELAARMATAGWESVVAGAWRDLTSALARVGPGSVRALPDREVARLAWGLRDHEVRDRAMGLALGRSAAAAEVLWTELTRRVPPPLDAAPATLLAVTAWVRGDGAMANVALDRALSSDPGHTLARLLRDALDGCLRPAEVRRMIQDTLRHLDAAR
jgi:hypothetical protein